MTEVYCSNCTDLHRYQYDVDRVMLKEPAISYYMTRTGPRAYCITCDNLHQSLSGPETLVDVFTGKFNTMTLEEYLVAIIMET